MNLSSKSQIKISIEFKFKDFIVKVINWLKVYFLIFFFVAPCYIWLEIIILWCQAGRYCRLFAQINTWASFFCVWTITSPLRFEFDKKRWTKKKTFKKTQYLYKNFCKITVCQWHHQWTITMTYGAWSLLILFYSSEKTPFFLWLFISVLKAQQSINNTKAGF